MQWNWRGELQSLDEKLLTPAIKAIIDFWVVQLKQIKAMILSL